MPSAQDHIAAASIPHRNIGARPLLPRLALDHPLIGIMPVIEDHACDRRARKSDRMRPQVVNWRRSRV
jgi:hypothetical protein